MTEEREQYDIVEGEVVSLGTVQARGPAGVIEEASTIAKQLANIVNSRKLYSTISGRKYVKVEGWTTLGAMLGVLPREVETHRIDNGWQSTVELIRANDGQVIGRGSAICTTDERNWSDREDFAVRSMAITRATGKAYRLGFSWVMALAGYEPTPAEEMDSLPAPRRESHKTRRKPQSNGDTVNFGKYQGKSWQWVLQNDRDYLVWLRNNSDYERTVAKVKQLLGGGNSDAPQPQEPDTGAVAEEAAEVEQGGNGNQKATQSHDGRTEFWSVYWDEAASKGVPQGYAANIAKKYGEGEDGDWGKAISRLYDAVAEKAD